MIGVRRTEMAARQIQQVSTVLFDERPVEARLAPPLRAQRLADVRVVSGRGEWITGREMEEREGDGGDDDDESESLRPAANEKTEHRDLAYRFATSFAGARPMRSRGMRSLGGIDQSARSAHQASGRMPVT